MICETTARRSERKFVDLRLDEVTPDGTFTGYASLFGVVDLAKDAVERGAFAKSLGTRGAGGIRMLYQHDPNEPIGTWSEVAEDGKGLFVRGRLATGVERAREVLDLMRQGALDGLSIGFRTSRARTDKRTGVRHILEADLWEISIVTFPMLPGARVERVKAWRPGHGTEPRARIDLARAIRSAARMINERKAK
jgi:HK97 family phage prohead protease